ncbi:PDR/VanB family oxidoreductase [Pararhizobium sp. YC-54]|uniref:PDR/VanB family oxidoreductase n=1 Tax=Pararhizobium sp. YC-54 TaxID=2986920 RepID=UPI0021F7EB62|nr:PDR/VanB family oxidoreductase [Pararhizobium sp. YC-54]MCV9999367.1 PDR/VanB family oxidoreductase [Pararhizobium sp. YC-54]
MQMTLKSQVDPLPIAGSEAIVTRKSRLSADVVEVELAPSVEGEFEPFSGGSHIEIALAPELKRSYSLTNMPGERHRYVIAVKKDATSRGGSAFVHDRIDVGRRVFVSKPRNAFSLRKAATHSVLIAGGIGITPIWSMIQELSQTGSSWELCYACRTPADAVYRTEIECLAAKTGAKVQLFHSQHGQGLDIKSAIIGQEGRAVDFYACGPSSMLAEFKQVTAGIPQERVHYESFGKLAPEATAGQFEVVLARSGQAFNIAADSTILETLLDAGLDIEFGCQSGICGTCETSVLEGIPDHRDSCLTAAEKANGARIMICCSRAKSSRLVLDL